MSIRCQPSWLLAFLGSYFVLLPFRESIQELLARNQKPERFRLEVKLTDKLAHADIELPLVRGQGRGIRVEAAPIGIGQKSLDLGPVAGSDRNQGVRKRNQQGSVAPT